MQALIPPKGLTQLKKSIFGFLILSLCLCGCAKKEAPLPTKEVVTEVETHSPTHEAETEPYSEPTESITEEKTQAEEAGKLLEYAEKYKTEHIFTDKYVPLKSWLVGSESIVEVISAGGIDSVTVTEHTSVERVGYFNAGEFISVTVYDKAKGSISIMLAPDEANKLLALLEEN